MAETPVIDAQRFGWLQTVFGAYLIAASLVGLASWVASLTSWHGLDGPEFFMPVARGLLGGLMVADGVGEIRTNRRNASSYQLLIAWCLLQYVGRWLQGTGHG